MDLAVTNVKNYDNIWSQNQIFLAFVIIVAVALNIRWLSLPKWVEFDINLSL